MQPKTRREDELEREVSALRRRNAELQRANEYLVDEVLRTQRPAENRFSVSRGVPLVVGQNRR